VRGAAAARLRAATTILTSPPFLTSLFLLLLNDWLLKPAFGSWLTGKLSDFAGLFVFALFWTALLPRRRVGVFATTAIGFLLWKSPLSAPALEAWNALGVWPLARVVDYTDWLALVALLPAYLVIRRHPTGAWARDVATPRRLGAILTGCIAVGAFAATSVPPPSYAIDDPVGYGIAAPKAEVIPALHRLGLHVASATHGKDRMADVDTLVVYVRHPPERHVGVWVEVGAVASSETRLRMLKASTFGPEPTSDALHRAFTVQVVEPLRAALSGREPPDA
jgi:hypothetical protein